MKKRIVIFFVILLISTLALATYRIHIKNNPLIGEPDVLTRGTGIYPTVQVNGELYEWHRGSAIIRELPDGALYYGELNHVKGTTPNNDCEFISVFDVSGQIYITENSCERIYVCLTTPWLESAIVMFDNVLD